MPLQGTLDIPQPTTAVDHDLDIIILSRGFHNGVANNKHFLALE